MMAANPWSKLATVQAQSRDLDKTLGQLSRFDKAMGAREVILKQAMDEVRPMVQGLLQQNFAASGIQSQTGKLTGAVANAVVTLVSSGIKVTLPDSGYYRSKGPGAVQTPFYRVAASLNYGAVRQAQERRKIVDTVGGSMNQPYMDTRGILGDKAKRTIKKIGLGVAVSQRALSSLGKGIKGKIVKRRGVGSNVKNDSARSVAVGDTVVIKPKPFFFFSESQRAQITEAFRVAVQGRINAFVKGGKK